MAERSQDPDGAEAQAPDEGTINHPLTQSDEEAPRKDFEGMKPE